MIDPNHRRLSIVRQCELVTISRSSFYYEGKGETALNLELMRLIDEQFLDTPYYGSRQMTGLLRWPQTDSALDAQDGPDPDLPETSDF